VNLAPGITGLLPKSKIAASEKAAAIDPQTRGRHHRDHRWHQCQGSENLPGDRRCVDDQGWQEYAGGTANSMGSLGDQLQKALSRQKKGD
jgi:small subunit ribosomal protein S1